MRFTCTGLAQPAVSESPTETAPASTSSAAMRMTQSSDTVPSMEHPKAVEMPTSTEGREPDGMALHSSHVLRTCSIACSGVMRIFDMLCAREAETGKFNL